ncbi:unnamed protein product [Prunus armeniaca]
MTFLTLTPWLRRNAYDEDERVWYEECISTRFIWPVEEAVRGALKNVDWDPLVPKAGKGKKDPAVLPRPGTPAAAVPRVAAPPSVRATVVTSAAAPSPRAPAVVGAQKTSAHRTVPSAPPARPIAAVALGRKRDREASNIGAATAEGVAVEMAVLERPRKRVLLVLSEAEDEKEVPPKIVSEAPCMTVMSEELADEVATAEVVAEGTATAEVVEMMDAEAAVAEVLATEAAADVSDDEVLTVDPTRAILVEIPSAASAAPTLAVPAFVQPLPSAPRCLGGRAIRRYWTAGRGSDRVFGLDDSDW